MNKISLPNSLSSAAKTMADKATYFFIFYFLCFGFSLLSRFRIEHLAGRFITTIVLASGFIFLSGGIYGSLTDAVKRKTNKISTLLAYGRKFFFSYLVYTLFLGLIFISIMLVLKFFNKHLFTSHLDIRKLTILSSTIISILNIYALPALFYYNTSVGDAFLKGLFFLRKEIQFTLVLIPIIIVGIVINMFSIPPSVKNLIFTFSHLYVFVVAVNVLEKEINTTQKTN